MNDKDLDKNSDLSSINKQVNLSLFPPILLIIMPGSLHLVDYCLKQIPTSENIILILNGLDNWEKQWVEENLQYSYSLATDRVIDHPILLNYAFKNIDRPFGIIDYDCFFTTYSAYNIFTTITHNTLGNALFTQYIPKLNIWLPHTHALFFNTIAVKDIFEKYSVDCNRVSYDNLTYSLKEKIKQIGITEHNLPEEDFNFDTCKLAILLAITEGKFFKRFNKNVKPLAHHIGCMSNPEDLSSIWRMRASYFWQSALDLHPDNELKLRYRDLFPTLRDIEEIKRSLERANDFSSLRRIESVLLFLKNKMYQTTN